MSDCYPIDEHTKSREEQLSSSSTSIEFARRVRDGEPAFSAHDNSRRVIAEAAVVDQARRAEYMAEFEAEVAAPTASYRPAAPPPRPKPAIRLVAADGHRVADSDDEDRIRKLNAALADISAERTSRKLHPSFDPSNPKPPRAA